MDPTFIWQSGYDFILHHLPYVSPFYFWLFWGVVVSAIAGVIGWGFPVLRGVSAAVIMSVIAGLTGYQRGYYDRKRHDE